MARAQKLKVFRTPIGFHDAYVAAPSQKAALEAWGADSNLFASRSAELVEDAKLAKEPLAHPGKVIKRLRGTFDEHIAALPKRPTKAGAKSQPAPSPLKAPRVKPRPKRDALDRVEAQVAALETEHARKIAELDRKQTALDRERRSIERKQDAERQRIERRLIAAHHKYETAMVSWRAD